MAMLIPDGWMIEYEHEAQISPLLLESSKRFYNSEQSYTVHWIFH